MKRHFYLICFMGLVISTQLFAQPHNYFAGKVIHSVTKEPLPFASVWLKKNKLGVITNADGGFKISNNPDFESDSLIITFIGFKRTAVAFNKLDDGKTNNIYLKPNNIKLLDVDIVASAKNIDSKAIIRKAIKKITENYHAKPFNYISYYRDYQKKDNSYFNLNEALVQTLDTGINVSSTENKFRLLDFKENQDFKRMELSPYYDSLVYKLENPNKFIKYGMLPDQGGNELFILMIHDPIRNFQSQTFSFVNTLTKDFILNHKFSDPVPVYNNNLMLHKISFMAKPYLTGDSLIVSGDIYIQPITYSIHKLNYSGYYLLKGNEKKKMFDVDIEYGQPESGDPMMELKYISFNNIFNVIDKADTTYFRVIKSDIIKTENFTKVILEFNHTPNLESVTNKDNYEIQLNDKPVKAKDLQIRVIRKKIYFTISYSGIMSSRVTIVPHNIKDINGKILNKRNNLEFYQYRELFVQEFNKNIAFSENCYMQNVPMIQNCISKYVGDQKYWMNTPLNTDTIKGFSSPVSTDQVVKVGKKIK